MSRATNRRLPGAKRVWFYLSLFKPRGWVSVIVTAVTIAYAVLAMWRDEGGERQPPLFFADVAGWLPWWAWINAVLVAALIVVLESAYKLKESAADSSIQTSDECETELRRLKRRFNATI